MSRHYQHFRFTSRWPLAFGLALVLALLLVSDTAPVRVGAAGGDLDTTFDGDGRVTTHFGGNNDNARALAIQSDGKILAAGNSVTSGIPSDLDFALARYNPDGSLDTTFSGDGRVSTDFSTNSFDRIFAIAIQTDGKIVAVGHTGTSDASDLALARYNPDGSLDTSFGGDGKVTTDFFGFRDEARDVAIQSNGSIVISGQSMNGNDFDFALARFNGDGSLDTTFDGDGLVTTGFFNLNDEANAIAIQTDGKIIAAGNARNFTASVTVFFALARYNTDGSLDTSFDGDGLVTTDSPTTPSSHRAWDIVIQPDGKIVGAGESDFSQFLLLRYNQDGSLDTAFDGDGIATTSFGANISTEVRAVALQSDGRIVAAGFYEPDGMVGSFSLARYNTDGGLDTSFDVDGRVVTSFGPQGAVAYAVAIQADGKIVAGGDAFGSGTGADFGLARYESSGNAPPLLSNVAVTTPIDENGVATLSGNISDPNAGDTFTVTVNWGDGSPAQIFNYPAGTVSFSETHQYLDDDPTATPADTYTINLTLSDNNGGTDTGSTSVNVTNAAPTLSNIAANPPIIGPGDTTTLSGNVNDAGTLDTHAVEINWGDGSPNTVLNLAAGVTTFSADHLYNAGGNFNLVLTATDDDMGSGTGGTTVRVNRPPVLSNVAVSTPVTENGSATLSGDISDLDGGDAFSLTVDWGDGSPIEVFNYPPGVFSFNQTHQYLDDNPTGTSSDNYTLSLTLSDGTASDTDSTVVTINNALPTLSGVTANPSTINVGSTTNLSGTVNDAGGLDPHTIVIDWADGTSATTLNLAAGVTTFASSHQYNASGNFNIGVTATDDDTGSATAGANVTVNAEPQQPPVLSNVAITTPISEYGAATLSGNISDPNAGDNFTLFVSWGDGSIQQAFDYPAGTTSFSVTHQYRDDNPSGTPADSYTINLMLIDNAGGSDTDAAFVTVNNLAPALSGIAATPSTINVNNSTTLSATVTDIGTLDTHQIVIDWGDGSPATTLNLAAGVTTFSANHQYNEVGNFNIGVTATDDDTGAATGGAAVTVNAQEKIVFASDRDGNGEIYVMNSDGTNLKRLTNNTTTDFFPSFSSDGSKIVFNSVRDGNPEIYVMNADGSNPIRVTNNPATDYEPSFTPDGSRIVFYSLRNNNWDIYAINTDGTNQTRLTSHPRIDAYPAFSPDGSRIAFVSYRDSNGGEIYVMNADGSNVIRLTDNQAQDLSPSFSPDGSRITFASDRDRRAYFQIYAMNADGTNQIRLTANQASDSSPSFSPDGSRITFSSFRDGNNEIYLMNANGSNQINLSNIPAGDFDPSFRLPAQEKVVFTSGRDGNYEIYKMNSDGSNQVNLTNNPAFDITPSLSPDGGRVVFSSIRNGNQDIYGMNADGSNQTRLTTHAADEYDPTFSPDGKRIAFTSLRDGNYEVYVMNVDGTNQIRLTNNAAFDGASGFSPDGSMIAFVSSRDGNNEIYVMNSFNGANPTNLTTNSADDNSPAFSPDGGRIVFTSDRDGNYEVYVMNAAGTGLVNLTNDSAADSEPFFTPDGSRIAFTSTRSGNNEIHLMSANGSYLTRLTTSPSDDVSAVFRIPFRPAPPQKIAFSSNRDGNTEIYVMNAADGSNQVNLTNNPGEDNMPSISPDGSRIAFTSDRDGNSEIYVMNSDGSNQTRLTNNAASDFEPSFSFDGSRIAFISVRDGNWEIYVMKSDGTNQVNLTNNPAEDLDPSFSTDGSRILFASNRSIGGNYDIYVMNANGTNPTRLTSNPGVEDSPSYSPDGNRILFIHYNNVNNIDIYVMNSNGTNQTRLTNAPGWDVEPSFSPDGSRIAFSSQRDNNFEIYVMNAADGTNQTRLTFNQAFDFFPSWGP